MKKKAAAFAALMVALVLLFGMTVLAGEDPDEEKCDYGDGEHHTWEDTETRDPTCTEDGGRLYRCINEGCSATKLDNRIPATGHKPGGEVRENETAATCTTPGGYDLVTYCTVCGAETSREHIDVTVDHTPGEPVHENETAATCTTPGGYDLVTRCTVCQTILDSQHVDIPAAGHKNGEEKRENETTATCATPGGYDLVTKCTVCGEETSRKHIDTTADHAPGEPVHENESAPTCTAAGYYEEVVYCSVCGVELSRAAVELSPVPHTPLAVEAVAPTCLAEGNIAYWQCQTCGGFFTDEACTQALTREAVILPANGHQPGTKKRENIVKGDPPCREHGTCDVVIYCTVCNAELERKAKKLRLTDHKLETVSRKDPTCTEGGWERHYRCKICGLLFSNTKKKKGETTEQIGAKLGALGHAIASNDHIEYECDVCSRQGVSHHERWCTRPGCGWREETEETVRRDDYIPDLVVVPRKYIEGSDELYYRDHYRCPNCGRLYANWKGTEPIDEPQIVYMGDLRPGDRIRIAGRTYIISGKGSDILNKDEQFRTREFSDNTSGTSGWFGADNPRDDLTGHSVVSLKWYEYQVQTEYKRRLNELEDRVADGIDLDELRDLVERYYAMDPDDPDWVFKLIEFYTEKSEELRPPGHNLFEGMTLFIEIGDEWDLEDIMEITGNPDIQIVKNEVDGVIKRYAVVEF